VVAVAHDGSGDPEDLDEHIVLLHVDGELTYDEFLFLLQKWRKKTHFSGIRNSQVCAKASSCRVKRCAEACHAATGARVCATHTVVPFPMLPDD
jgi:hypothetical protein